MQQTYRIVDQSGDRRFALEQAVKYATAVMESNSMARMVIDEHSIVNIATVFETWLERPVE